MAAPIAELRDSTQHIRRAREFNWPCLCRDSWLPDAIHF